MRRIILVVIVFLIIIFGFIWFWRTITRPRQPRPVVENAVLTDYATTDTVTKYIASGKIVGDDQHNEVHITIGRNQRLMQIMQGYQNAVVQSDTFNNNESAYKAFLAALHNSGYTRSARANPTIIPEGACPMGRRFWYQIIDNTDFKQSLWSTNCASIRGTFGGNNNTVQWLFENQILDYDNRTRDYNL